MANPLYGTSNFSTTLNVGGGIDNSQTSGIVLTSVSGLNTNGGMLGLTWSSTLDTSTYEIIEYGGVSGNELTGVVRGQAGTSAKAHNNGATIVAVVSAVHNNRIADKLRSVDATLSQDPNNNEIIKTSYVASAVNEVTITNAATGNHPTVEATGGDTNIDLQLKGKGSGRVKVYNGSSYIEVGGAATSLQDSNGVDAVLTSATASAVNEVTVTNAATAGTPTIGATGDDTNIHLALKGKGNGLVKITVLQQADTTDSYLTNAVILTGWGYATFSGSSISVSESVTFGITFAARPVVVTGSLGLKDGSNPSHIGDTTGADQPGGTSATGISTTGFTAGVRLFLTGGYSSNPASSTRGVYSWIAIGQLS